MANAFLLEPLVPASISMFGSYPGFDFSGGSLPSGASLTRASAAWRFNASGVLASAAIDAARFDYDPSASPTPTLKGLLIEPAATNVLLRSQELDNAAWATSQMSVTANAAAAPDGTTTMDKLVPSTSSAAHNVNQSGLAVSGGAAQHELVVKAAGYSKISMKESSSSGNYASFDLSAVSVLASTMSGASIVALGGGLYLISANVSGATTQGLQINVLAPAYTAGDPNGSIFAGDGTSGVLVWQAQIATGGGGSIIPTTSASASRSADAGVLNWASKGAADGSITVRYTFDDASTQDVTTTVSGGNAAIPTNLNRRWITKAQLVGGSGGNPDVGVATNLLNDYAGVIAQASCALNSTNQAIIALDLGADTSIDMILVFGVELFPASGALKINYATSVQGNFTGAYSTDTSGVPYAGSASMTTGKGVSFWRLAAPVTARYVQIVYEAGAGVTGKSVKVSRLVIGKSIQLSRNYAFGGGPGVKDLGSADFSARAVLLRRRAKKLRTQQITFSNIEKWEVEASIRPLLERTGNTEMIALVTDPAVDADRQNKCYFGVLVGDLGAVRRNARVWESKINMLSIF